MTARLFIPLSFIWLLLLFDFLLLLFGDPFVAALLKSPLDLMALLEISFCCLRPEVATRPEVANNNFRLLTAFIDLTLALGEEDGLDALDWLLEDFGRVNLGGFFLVFDEIPSSPSKSITNVSQPPRLTTSCTRNETFGSQYLYELSFFDRSLFELSFLDLSFRSTICPLFLRLTLLFLTGCPPPLSWSFKISDLLTILS